jgi:uncharacterized protein
MHILRGLLAVISAIVRWLIGHARSLVGHDEKSLSARLISAIALASIVMAFVFSGKLIRAYTRVDITLATAGRGGEYHAFGASLKQVIDTTKKRVRITLEETPGSRENIQRLESEMVDLAIVQHDTPTKPSVQAVASLFPELLHVLVDMDIAGIPDLKGKRIAVSPSLLGENGDPNDPNSFFCRFIQRHSIARADVKLSRLDNLEDAGNAFLRRDVDAIVMFIAVENECMAELLRQPARPAGLLPVDVNTVKSWYPYVENAIIPRGAFWSTPAIPGKDIATVSVRALLLTHERVEASAIAEITRVLYEHRNTLMAANPRAATVRLPNSGEDLGIALHAGAKAYYRRDKPGFLVTYADPIALFFSLSVLCISTTWRLRLNFQQRQKNRADKYNLEILGLIEQSHQIKSMAELLEVRQKLFSIFKRVIQDLDEDRLSVESFQLFNIPCQVAIGAIRHREWVLTHMSGDNGVA